MKDSRDPPLSDPILLPFPLSKIHSRYSLLLQRLASDEEKRREWQKTPKELLALLILFDQLGRHIKRHHTRMKREGPTEGGTEEGKEGGEEGGTARSYPSQGQTDGIALGLAREMQSRGWLSHLHLSVPEHVFALMPLRHSPTVER